MRGSPDNLSTQKENVMKNLKRCARRGLLVAILVAMFGVISSSLHATTQHSSSRHSSILQGSITVHEDQEHMFPALAKLTIQDAIVAAQAEVPGQVLAIELEEEDGYLVYEVETVEGPGAISEVLVDGGNGTVLQLEQNHEDEDDD
jgi:uncharacterized membrane protein YkoI